MMMPPQSQGPHSPGLSGNWRAWQCNNCFVWNDLLHLHCLNCNSPRRPNNLVGNLTIMNPASQGSHSRSDRAFRVWVVISLLLIVSILVVSILHSTFPSSASSPAPSYGHRGGDTLYKAEWLNPADDYLLSSNGRYELRFQRDGNLVEYDHGDHNKPLWASNTANKGATIAKLQLDGNFVIYAAKSGYALFATSTNLSRHGTSGNRLVMRNDAAIVIYDEKGQVLWQARP
jgi:hypothetical protein